MFTKQYLKDNKDADNKVKLIFLINWQETSLSRLYDILDQRVEGGSLADIVSVKPLNLDNERDLLEVEIVIDVSDVFNIPDSGEEVESSED